jgi:hypothetical protein
MTRCLSDHELQALADGEGRADERRHAGACAQCAERLHARVLLNARVANAIHSQDLTAARRDALRARISSPASGGGTTLRFVPSMSKWFWPGAATAAAALILLFVVVPGIDRQTTVSASEILDRSRNTLSVQLFGIEVLTYDLELNGVLGELLPAEQAGRFTIEETIDHDRNGRYRLLKLAPDGQVVGGAADDPVRRLRIRYFRADGRGYLLRFSGADAAAMSLPALKRTALQTFITMMQAHTGKTLREVQRDGAAVYEIDIPESRAASGSIVSLERGHAVITAADARLVEFSASGTITDRPFTIDFMLRSREMRPESSAGDADFDIAPQPGDVVLEGDTSGHALWDVVTRALGTIPAQASGGK